MEQNEVLDKFDRYVFESIVEKVIVGGLDENGNVDPAQLTFVYKTGLKNSVDGAKFKPQRKNARGRHRTDELCSHDSNEVDKMCSDSSNDTCGDGSFIVQTRIIVGWFDDWKVKNYYISQRILGSRWLEFEEVLYKSIHAWHLLTRS